jgi:hypothetical protein
MSKNMGRRKAALSFERMFISRTAFLKSPRLSIVGVPALRNVREEQF